MHFTRLPLNKNGEAWTDKPCFLCSGLLLLKKMQGSALHLAHRVPKTTEELRNQGGTDIPTYNAKPSFDNISKLLENQF